MILIRETICVCQSGSTCEQQEVGVWSADSLVGFTPSMKLRCTVSNSGHPGCENTFTTAVFCHTARCDTRAVETLAKGKWRLKYTETASKWGILGPDETRWKFELQDLVNHLSVCQSAGSGRFLFLWRHLNTTDIENVECLNLISNQLKHSTLVLIGPHSRSSDLSFFSEQESKSFYLELFPLWFWFSLRALQASDLHHLSCPRPSEPSTHPQLKRSPWIQKTTQNPPVLQKTPPTSEPACRRKSHVRYLNSSPRFMWRVFR